MSELNKNKYGYNCPFNDNGACKYKYPRKDEFICWICVDCCYIGCTNRECYCFMRIRDSKKKER